MTVGDVLDGSFRALRHAFGPIMLVVLVVVAPYHLLSNLLLRTVAPAGFESPFGAPQQEVFLDDVTQLFGATTLITLVGLLVNIVVGVAVVSLVLAVDRGQEADVRASLRTAMRRAPAVIAATLLIGVAALAVFVVAILFGVVLTTVAGPAGVLVFLLLIPVGLFAFALVAGVALLVVPIAVTEGRGPIATLGRALWVLRVRFWRLLGITLLVLLVVVAVTFALSVPFVLLSALAGPLDWIVGSVGDVLSSAVVVPVMTLAALLVYLDARIRFEGYDLEIRTRGLGTG